MPDRSSQVVQGLLDNDATAAARTGRRTATRLLEAGMNGDPRAWEEGILLACGVVLEETERERLDAVGGPPPLELERVLQSLGTPVRPHGHLGRLRLLGERYRLALDGDRDVLRWVETALGHPSGSLGRADLLGPHGLPLHVRDLSAGLESGPLPDDWLGWVGPYALADVCSIPAEPAPVWVQLRGVEMDPARSVGA